MVNASLNVDRESSARELRDPRDRRLRSSDTILTKQRFNFYVFKSIVKEKLEYT